LFWIIPFWGVMQKYPLTVLIYLDVFLQYARGSVLIKLSIGTLIATIPIEYYNWKGWGSPGKVVPDQSETE